MQFKIPQNVEIEDKIVSFLTVKQLIILVSWWTVAYLVFLIFANAGFLPTLWGPFVLVIVLFTCAIAFLELNHLPFHKWLVLLIASFVVPQKRYWYNGYYWSLYLNAFTKTQVNKKKEKKKDEKSKKELDIDDIKASIWNEWNYYVDNNDLSFELDDEQKLEFYNRFQ